MIGVALKALAVIGLIVAAVVVTTSLPRLDAEARELWKRRRKARLTLVS